MNLLLNYDKYGNIANTEEEYLNIDVFVPGCDNTDGTYDGCVTA